MNIYLFFFDDNTVTFPCMVPAESLEQASAEYKQLLKANFGQLYEDVIPEEHLQQVLKGYAPEIPAVKYKKVDEVVTGVDRVMLGMIPLHEQQRKIFSQEDSETIIERASNCLDSQRRGVCETDPMFKQIIPYVIVKHGERFFVYKRLSGSGEKRLVDSYSIGVGGHMNFRPQDGDVDELKRVIIEEATRELNEELVFGPDVELTIDPTKMLVLNDDQAEVGKVHLGILLFAEVSSDDVLVRETDSLEGGFVTMDQIIENFDSLEDWSKMYVESLQTVEQ